MISSRLLLLTLAVHLLVREKPVIVFFGYMHSELDLAAEQGLRDAAQFSYLNLSFLFQLLDIVDILCSDDERTFLCPTEHVDLLDLVRKEETF